MGKIARCHGMGRIIGSAVDYDSLLKKHNRSVSQMSFHGTVDREDVGSAGYEDPEGGARSHRAVYVAGTVDGMVFMPDELLYDEGSRFGVAGPGCLSSGPASMVRNTLLEEELPASVEGQYGPMPEETRKVVTIKSIKRMGVDLYWVEADIEVDGIEY